MTDKQILDRLHNINLSHTQKMDLINVIKDIAKENSGENTPIIPPDLSNININITDNTARPTINIVCQYSGNTTNVHYITIFNEQVNNIDNSIIEYNTIINYFGLDEDININILIYTITMLIAGSICNITMYQFDSDNIVIKPITDFDFIPNVDENSFTIIYHSPTDNGEVTIVCSDNKNNGFEISW